mmetsp:Transcript_83177/g.268169  ORF Transcript_83177/g.268169 Transcript_83177/m.268169 type:complete len:337 (+) Transcript_83177:606-1616(+)
MLGSARAIGRGELGTDAVPRRGVARQCRQPWLADLGRRRAPRRPGLRVDFAAYPRPHRASEVPPVGSITNAEQAGELEREDLMAFGVRSVYRCCTGWVLDRSRIHCLAELGPLHVNRDEPRDGLPRPLVQRECAEHDTLSTETRQSRCDAAGVVDVGWRVWPCDRQALEGQSSALHRVHLVCYRRLVVPRHAGVVGRGAEVGRGEQACQRHVLRRLARGHFLGEVLEDIVGLTLNGTPRPHSELLGCGRWQLPNLIIFASKFKSCFVGSVSSANCPRLAQSSWVLQFCLPARLCAALSVRCQAPVVPDSLSPVGCYRVLASWHLGRGFLANLISNV